MSSQKCARCGKEEHIPTHQFLKFDASLRDLCAGCWTDFRVWFHASADREAACPESS